MILEKEREIRHALVIEEEELLKISGLIAEKYEEIEIIARCSDKTILKSKDINDIIRFENHNFRKIESISIKGFNSVEENLYLTIVNRDFISTTAEFSVSSKKEKDLNYILGKLDELFLGAKPWYNFLTKISVFWSLFFPLLSIISGVVAILYLYLKFTGKILQDTSKLNLSTAEVLLITIIIICLLYIICSPIDKLRGWLFPKLFFLLGRQKKTMEKIESVRKVLFIVICIGLVVSIVAGLLLRII